MKINVGPLLEDGVVEVANIFQLSQPPAKYQLINFLRFFYRSIFYYCTTCWNSKKVNIGLLRHWQ